MNTSTSASDAPDVYAPPRDSHAAPRAVYIHVPFCLHRCGYCDFTLLAQRDDLISSWLTALEAELQTQKQIHDVDTIFVGGGTPTHLSSGQLSQLGDLICRHFRLTPGGEFSIEANPDGLDDDRLSTLSEIGINRLSLGVQSFDDAVLHTLERQHAATEAAEVVERAHERIQNVSLDLIFGVPGQSVDSWQQSLTIASQLPLNHISTYGLTFEKGTDYFRRRSQGELEAIDEETERRMYADGIEFLIDQGFGHYEISNFARPGFECRHNLVYWAADEYFAFGPGAARYVNGVRSTNARNVVRWINLWMKGKRALQEFEELTPEAKAREAIFLGLRKTSGVHLDNHRVRFGYAIEQLCNSEFDRHMKLGNIEVQQDCLRLTEQGRFIADTVIADFL